MHLGQRFGSLSILGTHWWPHRVHFQPDTWNLALGTFSDRITAYLFSYAILSKHTHPLLLHGCRWIQRRVEAAMDARLPIEALAGRLDRIQVVAMARPGARKVKVVLQKLDREQSAVVKALRLARFVPN